MCCQLSHKKRRKDCMEWHARAVRHIRRALWSIRISSLCRSKQRSAHCHASNSCSLATHPASSNCFRQHIACRARAPEKGARLVCWEGRAPAAEVRLGLGRGCLQWRPHGSGRGAPLQEASSPDALDDPRRPAGSTPARSVPSPLQARVLMPSPAQSLLATAARARATRERDNAMHNALGYIRH